MVEKIMEKDIGRLVMCDTCSEDFTYRNESGGFIFNSWAVCPACSDEFLKDIEKYNEQSLIMAKCPENQSFADFIREHRG
jgi:formylmethanofuran dehydrogenase subunit E